MCCAADVYSLKSTSHTSTSGTGIRPLTSVSGQVSLVNFALKAYPEQIKYVDHILRFCGQFIEKKKGDEATDHGACPASWWGSPCCSASDTCPVQALNEDCVGHLEDLLTIPLRSYKSVMDVLALQHYTGLLTCLEPAQKNNVAVQVSLLHGELTTGAQLCSSAPTYRWLRVSCATKQRSMTWKRWSACWICSSPCWRSKRATTPWTRCTMAASAHAAMCPKPAL